MGIKFLGLLSGVFLIANVSFAQLRQHIPLDTGWRFQLGEEASAIDPAFDDTQWEEVRVPHDWAIKGPFDRGIDRQVVAIEQNGEKVPTEKTGRTGALPYIGVGWYRLKLPKIDFRSKRVTLMFDGAMSNAQVYLNGKKVGAWPYGYNSFYFDITDYLSEEDNVLSVRLENMPLSSRWYPGAGLYRPVELIVASKRGIENWGIFVKTRIEDAGGAGVHVTTELAGLAGRNIDVVTTITEKGGDRVVRRTQHIGSAGRVAEEVLLMPTPKLWSPESPDLYMAKVEIFEDGQVIDVDSVRFGVRKVEISAEGGFRLNGESRKLKGVCLHHDLGPLGAALNKAALRRQLEIMKDMGADAIRTAHNMPSTWQMDLCDELGLMVIAESFDEWKYPKVKNGYNLLFYEWAEKDLVNLIRRHRNHPSIVMWSIGNEVPEQGREDGGRIAKWLQDICHREDPTRKVTVGMDKVDSAIANGFAAVLDVPGMNYRTHRYENAYKKLPQGFLLGSETASTVSSRGIYRLPAVEGPNRTYPDGHSSSYDLEYCSWSNLPEDDWILQDDKLWVIGEFVWTGFDYLGEPTPYDEYWPSRSSYFGICDLAGIPKDRYYLYRSRWNKERHTLHLLPHWNWSEGDTVPVYCYTDYPEAELFVNGISQGKRRKDPSSRLDRYRLRWNKVRFRAGNLKVVAYDAEGVEKESRTINTAGKPAGLKLTADRTTLRKGEQDLAFVTVEVLDDKGNLCPHADNELTIEVTGAGSFKAVCNGDPTSLELFHLPKMKAFSGKLVVVLEGGDQIGRISLKVSGKKLETAQLYIKNL